MYFYNIYNFVHTRMFEPIQFKEATEKSLDVLNAPQSSWKYVENIYYMNVQLSFLSLYVFFLSKQLL